MKRVFTVLWSCALLAALYFVTTQTRDYAERDYRLISTPPLTELDGRFLTVLTLGHRGLYDDFINIWILQALMDSRLDRYEVDDTYRAILAVTRHNPKIESLYMIACFTLAFDFGKPEYCERITLDGVEALPESWRIPMTQGFISAYKLSDVKGAALYYGLAASRPEAPEFLKKLVANMLSKNALTTEELQQSLEQLLSVPGGSKFGDFLRSLSEKTQHGSP